MDRNYLLTTAGQISQVSIQANNEYSLKLDQLISKLNSFMMERPDIIELVGKNNLIMMKDNHANHARFIASILKFYNHEVFVDTVLWVFRAYRSHGFTTNYWASQLNSWIEVLKQTLSDESFLEIYPYYEWMQINIPIFVKVSDSQLDLPNSIH
jgi:hypothetical protein